LSPENLKLLIDVGLGRKVEEWMKHKNYDAKSIRDINPRMSDREILKIAMFERRLIITMDKDFGELIYKSKWPHSGVLLLRLEDERAREKIRVVETILKDYSSEIVNKFSVFKKNKLRIRK
jgi:predicted nuclease of predicted toxin-antitoxin system